MATNPAEYMREYMRQYRATGHDNRTVKRNDYPFVGVDGEGWTLGTGYHAYFLLRAGAAYISPDSGNVRLTTWQCLDFLAGLDPKKNYVGYFFDYDSTKILEDLGWSKLDRLIHRELRRRADGGGVFPVSYGPFEVDYLPRKYLKVKKMDGPWIEISDVGSFFQTKFYDTLKKWGVGTAEELADIKRGKDLRGSFELDDYEMILHYNALEIHLLETLMERFRDACRTTGYLPRRWQGPGLLAESMYAKHGVSKTRDVPLFNDDRFSSLLQFARNSFYGGRPEVSAVGPVDRPCWQYDINSAYPHAMLTVPCLHHGQWRSIDGHGQPISTLPDHTLALCYGTYRPHTNGQRPTFYGLPNRTKEGTITYPANGRGWYWGFEIAASVHQDFRVERAWLYRAECECRPLEFVRDVYRSRQALGKDSAGTILKLGLNSLYGKSVQSIGSPQYANPVWASYITAHCRTAVQRFIHQSDWCIDENRRCGRDVLMVATDSVLTFSERDIEPSEELGGWSVEHHPQGVFLVQPGLYFGSSGRHAKTRGVPLSVIEHRLGEFRDRFVKMVDTKRLDDGDVYVPQQVFVGIRYALHRHNLKLLGQWIEFEDSETGQKGKRISFDWTSKRARWPVISPVPGSHPWIETFPPEGSTDVATLPYSKDIGGLVARQIERLAFEDQPDWIDNLADTIGE